MSPTFPLCNMATLTGVFHLSLLGLTTPAYANLHFDLLTIIVFCAAHLSSSCLCIWGSKSVERATPGKEVLGSIPLWLPAPYWLGRCQYNVTGRDRSHDPPALSRMWQHVKLSDVSLGTRPRYGLVVDEDVKKPNKQTNLRIGSPEDT